jgi:hypothetical protein
MADLKRDSGLRTIFSFFLGLMLTAFVGVAVYTFHPPPERTDRQLRELSRHEQEVRTSKAPDQMTAAEREQIRQIERQRDSLVEVAAEARKPWGRSTSVILIAFATLAMAISLVRADQLPVISNGLLLGGLFTMLYGVGWIVVTDTSITRFLVMTAALVITLGLGYVRFVRRGASSPVAIASTQPANEGLAQIEWRIRSLEERMNEAARALGQDGDKSKLP